MMSGVWCQSSRPGVQPIPFYTQTLLQITQVNAFIGCWGPSLLVLLLLLLGCLILTCAHTSATCRTP
jgi:hypothetical protein